MSLKGSVALCRSPLRICMHNDVLLLYFFFGSTLFLKFMFLYVHLVLTTVSFFSMCTHQILLLHSHNDRHLHSLQHLTSKAMLEQTILYKSIYQSIINFLKYIIHTHIWLLDRCIIILLNSSNLLSRLAYQIYISTCSA